MIDYSVFIDKFEICMHSMDVNVHVVCVRDGRGRRVIIVCVLCTACFVEDWLCTYSGSSENPWMMISIILSDGRS